MRRLRAAAAGVVAATALGVAPYAAGASSDGDPAGATPAGVHRPAAGNPLEMTDGFYVDPNSNPAAWVAANAGDGRAGPIREQIAGRPLARWFGDWDLDIGTNVAAYVDAAALADRLPVLVAYNIPGRDCGSHSGGGAEDAAAYRAWIDAFAAGIGQRPALVILEPDALAQLDACLDDAGQRTRLDLLRYATDRLAAQAPSTWTYHDAGNAGWIAADVMAQRLASAGLAHAHGFSVNVSNYKTTQDSASYAQSLNAQLSARHGYTRPFVVDTSRNGSGPLGGEWCNPSGRMLGAPPQEGGASGAELLLWIKVPGDSDGECGMAPDVPAGQFSPDIAMRLIEGT
ncbi:glycoside hydrolase family 6 protein [Streptomyces sp. 6N223]|uniref:glycoside hydrolase family 6 protein n=1 Tax=Streptomyces sp. 6N223 TaxID=3457412 RepID=UPI003FCF3723